MPPRSSPERGTPPRFGARATRGPTGSTAALLGSKVLVDNFMEAYHHIAIHRDLLQPIFPARLFHVPDNQGPYSVLAMPTR
ncbi:MAG: hypothetical protein P8R42_18190 [Candidatus Binatia bacterium]|nr:hypothetical protein [Candidatus Binatia bacterium]